MRVDHLAVRHAGVGAGLAADAVLALGANGTEKGFLGMNATMRSLNWGTAAVGSLVGGFLGDAIGLAPTLVVGACGSLASTAWLVFSPVPRLREAPQVQPETAIQPPDHT